MTIKQIRRESETELMLEGRLDTTTAPEAETIMMQAAQATNKLVLNLEQTQYVSSAGLRTFKRMHMTMMQKGGSLYLKAVPKAVMEVLEMTGFSGVLSFI